MLPLLNPKRPFVGLRGQTGEGLAFSAPPSQSYRLGSRSKDLIARSRLLARWLATSGFRCFPANSINLEL